ncbi:ABC transporter permease [Bifidobacterium crudilactis]|uniref:ABC transporter permease n=2 Tax=Bifidobacterium crudilactis TaxID=327277 RepID=A0A971CYT9_9BIFI|nr:ABC transporter permease [Bifidobacterium crudilactis]MCI1868345.1 ABC transporter permease [Bifidobacterium crudilactis]MDN6000001.1 ABC transporter permease [Bifidobacterium crudilactis]MDN6458608.1 ABC transporter permease [Bifidobacterium crudilactis]MDN6466621.1 ABC transporter permease [Bifidobacterium crudilactis]MDN6522055.1 ABC transporter permease [Bifidobacterium crudilactis]
MRTIAMIRRVLTELLRDKRTLALMFAAPLLILTLMYFLFQGANNINADIAVQSVDTDLVSAMKIDGLHIHEVNGTAADDNTETHARKVIRDNDYAGFLSQSDDSLTLTLAGADQSQSGLILQSLTTAQTKLSAKAASATIASQAAALKQLQSTVAELTTQLQAIQAASPGAAASQAQSSAGTDAQAPSSQQTAGAAPSSVTVKYLYGSEDSTFFDTLVPIMMGFVIFFFVFLISGIGLLHERTTGTLNRLLATPIRKREIIFGYLVGYGIVAIVQTAVVVGYTLVVFKTQILGSLWNVVLLNLMIAGAALTLGLLVSSFAATEFQMMQFIPIIVIPQIFFSGIIPVESMPGWLQAVAHAMPLYWGSRGMSDVVVKGASLAQIAPNLGVLLAFILVFLGLNLVVMRKYRRV